MFGNIYKGKKVLITGHTGFKGSWLSIWLNSLGAEVVGLSYPNLPSTPCIFEICNLSNFVQDFRVDINNTVAVKDFVVQSQPDFVFHLAAQALVRESYDDPLNTIMTNVIGTVNILNALRAIDKKVVAVMITSDKAYDNVEWVWGYKETDRLGGSDPYSASKGMAELAIKAYVESYFNQKDSNVTIGISRAGNVIGGGDWSKDRIVPDSMRSWSKNKELEMRNPDSTRPWQHVLEPLSGYLLLGEDLFKNRKNHGQAYNFGPLVGSSDHSVRDLIFSMSKYWNKVKWKDIPQEKNDFHEARLLKLNCDKVLYDLNWIPVLQFEATAEMTVNWYKEYYTKNPEEMHQFTLSQIKEYELAAKLMNTVWSLN